jgi:hypothetical protein
MTEVDYPEVYAKAVTSLEEFLYAAFDLQPPFCVSVYAFDCPEVGGFRIVEIAIHGATSGASFMRVNADCGCLALILAAEDYVRMFNVKAYRPDGWDTDIDDFADAKFKLTKIVEGLGDAS